MRVIGFGLVAVAVAAGVLLLSTMRHESSAVGGSDDLPIFRGTMASFARVQPPRPAPLTAMFDAKGNRLDLSVFRGKVVLMNFWATWCAPCVREMPTLDRLQAEMGGENFTVLALSIDQGGLETVMPFFKKLGLKNLSIFLDPKHAAVSAFGIRGLPTTYLIDHRGNMVGGLLGPAEWDSDEAKALMRHYIEKIADFNRRSDALSGGGHVNALARIPGVFAVDISG